ncbi:hypothetical protein ACQ4PT_012478 [Festuca glaucescens]
MDQQPPPPPRPSEAMEAQAPWRVLEFYSGIGGMRYSLASSGVRVEVVEAFDINDVANDVYERNFGHRPCQVPSVPQKSKRSPNLDLRRQPKVSCWVKIFG